jgi:hypothetical protein
MLLGEWSWLDVGVTFVVLFYQRDVIRVVESFGESVWKIA